MSYIVNLRDIPTDVPEFIYPSKSYLLKYSLLLGLLAFIARNSF